MSDVLTLVGLDALVAQLTQPLEPALQAVTVAVGYEVQDKMATYPGTTGANNSNNKRWYVRGTGGFYRSRNGVKQTSSSQTLNRKWRVRPDGSNAVVENDASYGPYVQAKEQQSRAMASIGWTTDQQAVDLVESSGTAQRIAEDVIKQQLGL